MGKEESKAASLSLRVLRNGQAFLCFTCAWSSKLFNSNAYYRKKELKINKKGIKQFYTLWFHCVASQCIIMLQNGTAVFYALLGYDSSPIYLVLNGRNETQMALR